MKPIKHKDGSGFIVLLLILIILLACILAGVNPFGFFDTNGDNVGLLLFPHQTSLSNNTSGTPTPTSVSCSNNQAVAFVINTDKNMTSDRAKIVEQATDAFMGSYPSQGYLSLITYSDYTDFAIPFDQESNISTSQFHSSLEADLFPSGTSPMLTAFQNIYQYFTGFVQPAFNGSGRKESMIIIADDVPETDTCSWQDQQNQTCAQFAGQNPISAINQLKNLGITIYTISFTNSPDTQFNVLLQQLMQSLATSPSTIHSWNTGTETELENALSLIYQDMCK